MLARNLALTAVAILTLALGLGLNSAMFAFLDSVLNLHYPIKDQERIANLWAFNNTAGAARNPLSIPDFLDYRQQNQAFEDLAAYSGQDFQLTAVHEPKQLGGVRASCNYFGVLGVQPVLGRNFLPEECAPGGPRVAILSHGLWQTSFGADPGIIGRNITLDRESYAVIGVMPAGFRLFAGNGDLWVPLNLGSSALSRGVRRVFVIGRIRSGASKEQAQAEMSSLARRLAQAYPNTNKGWEVQVVPLQEEIDKKLGLGLAFVMGPVVLVLLIACANVANLLLARASAREKEMAVRLAMGAGRTRLVRQLLTESVLLALAGGALGLLLGAWGMAILRSLLGGAITVSAGALGLHPRVLGFALILSLLTPLVFGLAPALASSKLDLNETLKEGRRRSKTSGGSHRLREYLVVSEVGLAIALLGLGGLLIRGMMVLGNIQDFPEPKTLLTMSVSLPAAAYPHDPDVAAFYHKLLERAQNIPGVESVGVTDRLPVLGEDRRVLSPIGLERERGRAARDSAIVLKVSPGYFRALRIPLRRGRALEEQDTPGAPRVAVINETLAASWHGEDPLGRRLRLEGLGPEQPWLTVVGLAEDSLIDVREAPLPGVYLPYAQNPEPAMTLALRALASPRGLVEPLKRALWSVDKDLPAADVRTQEQRRSEVLAQPLAMVRMLVAFALLALTLASAGVYSVTSYVVAQRTHEFGIRMSLGARPRDVLFMVVREAITLVAGGLCLGLAGALVFGRLLGNELMGIRFYDPLVFSCVSLLLMAVALLASYIPARRATKVDPMEALRYE
jgi:putative ABC transport system permease protein